MPASTDFMREGLAAVALYEREIRMLADRWSARSWLADRSLSLTAPLVASHARKVSRRLAAEVSADSYAFQPLIPHAAFLNGKPRTIYQLDPLDAVVWGVTTRVLMAAMEPHLGEHLHSYRKGRSQWTACRALHRYLHAHARARPDPRQRGVFVLRRDVRRYDEQIPVGDDSALWTTLERMLHGCDLGLRGDLSAFLRRTFRPLVQQADGTARPLDRGVPTGIPTQTIACNTYLLPLDAELSVIPDGFYARFGDDILFAHPNLERAEEVSGRLDASLSTLGLEFNPSKSQIFWLTRSGSAHLSAAHIPGVTRLPYLGLDVGFDGARLRSDKRRAFWLALRARILHTDRLLLGVPLAERAAALCAVVRACLEPVAKLSDRYAPWLRFDVMSLQDLKQLDHHIALLLAERLSGRRGVRAFRDVSKKSLYEEHGLPNLVYTYTQARHRRRSRP